MADQTQAASSRFSETGFAEIMWATLDDKDHISPKRRFWTVTAAQIMQVVGSVGSSQLRAGIYISRRAARNKKFSGSDSPTTRWKQSPVSSSFAGP
jgi:hypothetical protein